MAISSPGIGSGLDVSGLVSKPMSVKQQPLTALATKEGGYQSKLSAYGALKGALSSLQTAAKALDSAAKFSGAKASVASDATFSATAAGSAATGTYAVEVKQLALADQWSTGSAFGAASAVVNSNAGTLTIKVGGDSKDVAIGATSTLAQVRESTTPMPASRPPSSPARTDLAPMSRSWSFRPTPPVRPMQ
jgi:flagellar hook-associated protein 2